MLLKGDFYLGFNTGKISYLRLTFSVNELSCSVYFEKFFPSQNIYQDCYQLLNRALIFLKNLLWKDMSNMEFDFKKSDAEKNLELIIDNKDRDDFDPFLGDLGLKFSFDDTIKILPYLKMCHENLDKPQKFCDCSIDMRLFNRMIPG